MIFETVYIHRRKLSVGVTFLLATAIVLTAWYSSPDLLFEIGGTVSAFQMSMMDIETYHSDGIVIHEEDIEFMNRIYDDRNHEVGYCGVLEGDSINQFTMADTIEASQSHIVFTTENCPFNQYIEPEQRVIMHTHPGGSDWLSEQDKKVFLEGELELSCIQYDQIENNPEQEDWDGINCFEKEGIDSIEDEFPEVEVTVN